MTPDVSIVPDVDADEWEPPPLPEPEWIGESPLRPIPEGRAVDSDHALAAFTEDLDKRRRGEVVGLPWPVEWPALSRSLGPLEPGSLTVVASRPSVGKTMFGMHLLRALAAKGNRVLYVTRELTVTRLIRRHVAAYGADMYRLRSGDLVQHDFDALDNYQRDSQKWKAFYDDQSRTIEGINTEVILVQPDVIIVDYLQRLAYDTESEYAGITRIVNELQDLTLATNVPVVCLSQLSRPQKGFEAKAPAMSDTRGSGAVEERAANLILLHRHWEAASEDRYGKNVDIAKAPTSEGWFIVAKSADGEAGKFIPVIFNGPRMTITEKV